LQQNRRLTRGGSAFLPWQDVSALAPIVVAVVLSAHDQVAARRDAPRHRQDIPPAGKSGDER
jgi:hypothetical protein